MVDAAAAGNAALVQALTNVFLGLLNQQQLFFKLCETNPLTGDLSQDLTKWFENFEYQAELVTTLSADAKLTELKRCLKDRALEIFRTATNGQKDTYAHAKEFLKTNLAHPHQVGIWRQELYCRKKSENETVADYLRELKRLVNLAYSSEQEAARNLILKERFLSGLEVKEKAHPHYKLYKTAYLNLHNDLDTIISAVNATELNAKLFSLSSAVITNPSASDVQAMLHGTVRPQGRGSFQSRGRSQGRERPRQQQAGQQQQRNADQCAYCGFPGHDVGQCQLYADAKRRFGASQGRNACHHCGRPDHLRAACRVRQAAKDRLNGREPQLLDAPVGDHNQGVDPTGGPTLNAANDANHANHGLLAVNNAPPPDDNAPLPVDGVPPVNNVPPTANGTVPRPTGAPPLGDRRGQEGEDMNVDANVEHPPIADAEQPLSAADRHLVNEQRERLEEQQRRLDAQHRMLARQREFIVQLQRQAGVQHGQSGLFAAPQPQRNTSNRQAIETNPTLEELCLEPRGTADGRLAIPTIDPTTPTKEMLRLQLHQAAAARRRVPRPPREPEDPQSDGSGRESDSETGQ